MDGILIALGEDVHSLRLETGGDLRDQDAGLLRAARHLSQPCPCLIDVAGEQDRITLTGNVSIQGNGRRREIETGMNKGRERLCPERPQTHGEMQRV